MGFESLWAHQLYKSGGKLNFKTFLKRFKRKTKKLTKSFFLPFIRKLAPKKFKTINLLTFYHFFLWSELNHINRTGLTTALYLLRKKPAVIVETGTSAWGTDSTRLWDSYVKSFGGKLFSVDIRSEPREMLGNLGPLSLLFVDDSLNFLNNFNQHCQSTIDLVYLDSFDIDWKNPFPAMEHGLREFESVEKYLKIGSVVVIDDTPVGLSFIPESESDLANTIKTNLGVYPGKGALVLAKIKLKPDKYRIIYHNYNLVFEILH